MMIQDKILITMLGLYYICVFLVLLKDMITKSRFESLRIYESVIMVLVPFFGLLLIKVSPIWIVAEKNSQIAYFEEKANKPDVQQVDSERDKELTAVRDVLIFNTVEEKRKVIMDLFRHGAEKYIPILKVAINDEDTEVSHYASAALVDIKDRLIKTVSERNKIYQEQHTAAAAADYLSSLKQLIDSQVLQTNMALKYEKIFCDFLEAWSAGNMMSQTQWLPDYLRYLIDLGEEEKTLRTAAEFVDMTGSEAAYIAVLKAAHSFKKTQLFADYLARLKKQNITLSDQSYEFLQFFMRNEVHDEAN